MKALKVHARACKLGEQLAVFQLDAIEYGAHGQALHLQFSAQIGR